MKFDRILVVANETIAGPDLHQQILEMANPGAAIKVVAPALSSRLKYAFSDVDGPREEARQRLESSLALMTQSGIGASGDVGDADPVRAFEDAVALFEPDAVVVSTHPEGRSNWLENGVIEKIRSRTELPVTHVVVDLEAASSEPQKASA